MTRWTHLRTSPRSSSSGCQPAVLLEPSSQEPSSAPTLIWQWGRWPSIIMNILRKPRSFCLLLLLGKLAFSDNTRCSSHQWILLHRPQSAPLLRTTATALTNKYLLLPAQEVKLNIVHDWMATFWWWEPCLKTDPALRLLFLWPLQTSAWPESCVAYRDINVCEGNVGHL